MTKTPYWAVQCRPCGGMITLDLVRLNSEHKAVTPTPKPDPFEVECLLCRNPGTYAKSQVVMWQGPRPAPEFQPHPAFR